METHTVALADGRVAGFIDYGPPRGVPVLWCHGGPGSRLEPATFAGPASQAGFRIIGIDRPGYGKSNPKPERTIGDWVPDALAVADAVDAPRFIAVGVSTGGGYALALAAKVPARVIGVVACCALTDMRWGEGKAMMTAPAVAGIWNAPNRDAVVCWLKVVGSKEGQEAFNPLKGSICARTDCDAALFDDYLQSAMEDWQSDTIVPSLAHGAAAKQGWVTEINDAVTAFVTDKNVGTLQSRLAASCQAADVCE